MQLRWRMTDFDVGGAMIAADFVPWFSQGKLRATGTWIIGIYFDKH